MATRGPATTTAYKTEAQVKDLLAKCTTPLEKLRVEFPANQIGLLPKAAKKDDPTPKSGCRPGTSASVDGKYCGGSHVPSVHLDFVGHAALTERLLDADPGWGWEPMAKDEFGAPKFDGFGGLWIRLTVAGVTRIGYGDAQGKTAGSLAVKEIIGDALRNAGMRFGMALDLWHKGDLHDMAEEQGSDVGATAAAPSGDVREAKSLTPDFLAEATKDPKMTSLETADVWRRAKQVKAPAAMIQALAKLAQDRKATEEATAQQAEEYARVQSEKAAEAIRAGFEGAKEVTAEEINSNEKPF